MSDNEVVPPSSNRGVQNTLQDGLRACVDWLQVTFKHDISFQEICTVLGLDFDDFTPFETGKYGYSYHYRFGHISIYYSYDRLDKHLELTGQGCREYEEFGEYDWVSMLGMLLMLDVNITRFDLAIDDFKGYFTFKKLVKKIKNGEVRSRFKKARILESVFLNDGTNAGTTIYFGSAASDIQIRIYDKFQERIASGSTFDDDITFWIRTEIQLRDVRAKTAVYELTENIENVGRTAKSILKNYVTFCDKSHDKNKSRWSVSNFWIKFLGDVEKLKLTQIAPDMTVEKVKDWFEKSVLANFSLLTEVYDRENLINDWIEKGKLKQKKKHENMLKRYRRERQMLNDSLYEKRNHIRKRLSGRFVHTEIKKNVLRTNILQDKEI